MVWVEEIGVKVREGMVGEIGVRAREGMVEEIGVRVGEKTGVWMREIVMGEVAVATAAKGRAGARRVSRSVSRVI